MTKKRFVTALGAAALTLAGAMATAAPASAEPAGEHCALNAVTGEETCFASFTEAVRHASQGRVQSAPADLRSALSSPELKNTLAADAQRAGEVIQGTVFDNRDYGGDSLTIWGEAPCKKDGVVNYQIDLDDGWKNKISSVQPWANCWLWLYPEANLGGDRDGPFDENTAWVGEMLDDRTQSIGFS
ncbi:hypothetical protein CFN78_01700 [Amycolatopsis antarctica]|uniref:Secreted protein n=1 Tax=Amycolatopsis antarctica TaxID=1854586 RepID=A0A263D9X8_9PSEU|nr:hypothetical protein [Amycolatopsis antarctica]OZM75283.1 hypothetical protein CFN78_01700 [Amycolatopsis antarctica]